MWVERFGLDVCQLCAGSFPQALRWRWAVPGQARDDGWGQLSLPPIVRHPCHSHLV